MKRDDFQKYSLKIIPKKVSGNGNVTGNNGILEYKSEDKLFATFRNSENPKLALDTLVTVLTVVDNDVPIINDRKGRNVVTPGLIHIFPNPANRSEDKVINFSFETPLKILSAEINIYDALGNHISGISRTKLIHDNGNYQLGSWKLTTQESEPINSGSYIAVFTISYREGNRSRFERIIGIKR